MSLTAQSDAQGAVIDELSRPAGRVLSQRSSPGGWIAELRKAGGADADASTVQFVKERRIGAKQLHAVAFRTVDGQSRSFVIGTEQDKTGAWHVSGMAGGGGNDPHRERPWVNLAGWGWPARNLAEKPPSGKIVRVEHRWCQVSRAGRWIGA